MANDISPKTVNFTALGEVSDISSVSVWLRLWRQFLSLLETTVKTLFENDLVLRSHIQPGNIVFSLRGYDKPMPGCLPLDGREVSSAEYPALANVCGDGGATFKLPDFRDRYIKVSNGREAAGSLSVRDVTTSATSDRNTSIATVWVITGGRGNG